MTAYYYHRMNIMSEAGKSTVDLTAKKEEVSMEVDGDVRQGGSEEPLLDTGFTDTAFPQIVVNKMPRHSKKKDFEKFLSSKALKYRKCKVVPNKDFSFITFDNETDCQFATKALDRVEYRNSVLEITTRTHNSNGNNEKKRTGDDRDNNDREDKRMRSGENGTESPIKTAREAVTPWWDVPYEEQLVRKTKAMVKDCLNKSFREVRDAYVKWNKSAKWDGRPAVPVPSWITDTKNNELSWIEYLPIIASPEPIGYRNKCEFTFGVDSVDNLPGIGFRVSAFSQGVLVGSPQDCPNISKPMKILVNTVKQFLRETSTLKVYDMKTHTGVWRLLTVRYSKRTQQMIVMLCVSLKAVAPDVWAQELSRLTECILGITRTVDIDLEVEQEQEHGSAEALRADSTKCVKSPLVTGLCYQAYDGLSVPSTDHEVVRVFGEMTILENMNNCSFRVSPQAFFQVNTPCAELLYSSVMSAMQGADATSGGIEAVASSASANTTNPSSAASSSSVDNGNLLCLDVCSGTGTIGICCAKASMGHMIGVELCQAAVNDAIDNATLNGLTLFTNKASSASASKPVAFSGDANVTMNEAIKDDQEMADVKEQEEGTRSNKYECGFICSRAEAVLESLIGSKKPTGGIDLRPFQAMARDKKVLAVVDPPREGLHVDCLRAIRNCNRIERLVYVSCNPTKSLPKDLAMLCGPSNKKLPGQAFRPVKATPVDLFPHTPHCEMLMVLERC